MAIRIEQLSPFEVGKRHKEILPMLESAISHADGEYTVKDVIYQIEAGNQACLGLFEGVQLVGIFTVMLITYPRRRALRLVTMGGLPVNKWVDTEGPLVAYARDLECGSIEFWCRPGVTEVTKKHFNCHHQYNVVIREV